MVERTCKTCCYWRREGEVRKGIFEGKCTRYPPVRYDGYWMQARTKQDIECGEWRAEWPAEHNPPIYVR
jgi:hypothetical protein